MPEEPTLGEISRQLDAMRADVRAMAADLKHLPQTFVLRETWDLANGAFRVEVNRLDHGLSSVEHDVTQLKEKLDARFRQAVIIALSAFLGPIVTGAVLLVLSSAVGS